MEKYTQKNKLKKVIGVIGILFLIAGMIMTFINYKIVMNSGTVIGLIGIVLVIVYVYLNKRENKESCNKNIKYPIKNLIFMFLIYGFLGWLIEFTFFAITSGVLVNRGFLHIPVLPIYGFGGVLLTIMFRKNQHNIFLKSAIIASAMEYLTSLILEKAFGLRWWDYSNNPLNINGRICLLNTLMFGLGGYVIAKFFSPRLNNKLNNKNSKLIWVFDIAIIAIVGGDFVYALFNLNIGEGVTTVAELNSILPVSLIQFIS